MNCKPFLGFWGFFTTFYQNEIKIKPKISNNNSLFLENE